MNLPLPFPFRKDSYVSTFSDSFSLFDPRDYYEIEMPTQMASVMSVLTGSFGYEYSGAAYWEGNCWDLEFCNRRGAVFHHSLSLSYATCDDMAMEMLNDDSDPVFCFTGGTEEPLYYEQAKGFPTEREIFTRADGTVLAYLSKHTIRFTDSLIPQERPQVIKCLALYYAYINRGTAERVGE